MNQPLSTLSALAVVCMAALPPVQAQQVPGDAQAGKQKIAMCIGCHGIPGYQASFPEVHKVPMISGQSAKYISAALLAYQKGERKHPTMRGIAESLTDKDIADLSAYYEQHGKTGTEPPAKPRREPSAQVAELLKKGDLRFLPRREFRPVHRPVLPLDRGPTCRLPVRGPEVLQDRKQHPARSRQRHHGRLRQAVQQR